MPEIQEIAEISRRVLPVIFVPDCSKSMAGERIAAVKEAMQETLQVFGEFSKKDPDAKIKVKVLKYSTDERILSTPRF